MNAPNNVKDEIRTIATDRGLPAFDKRRRVYVLIKETLETAGRFFRTSDNRLFFFHVGEKRLYAMEGRDFGQLLTDVTGLNPTESFFRFVLESLIPEIARHGQTVDVAAIARFLPGSHELAVSNGGTGIWLYDRDGWTKQDNGAHGTIFLTQTDADPWEPDFSAQGSALTWFLDQFNFSGDEEQVSARKALLKVFLVSLFFRSVLHTKPILTFLGPQGSGKTTCSRFVGRLFLGQQFDVTGVREDKEDAFTAMMCSRLFCTLDNVDSPARWLENALARYATGERITLRRLFTTNEEASYNPTATLMVTSRDPHFRRSDVAERLLLLPLDRLTVFEEEEAVFSRLMSMRGKIMGDLMTVAAETVESYRLFKPPLLPFRMADFASIGWRIHKIRGTEDGWISILKSLDRDQQRFSSEGDGVVEALRFLSERGELDIMLVGELFKLAKDAADRIDLPFPTNAQGFGKRLKELRRVIEMELGLSMVSNQEGGGRLRVRFIPMVNSMPLAPLPSLSPGATVAEVAEVANQDTKPRIGSQLFFYSEER